MPFRRSEEKREGKRALQAEKQAEVDRLTALGPEDLAVEVLPTLATETATSATGVGIDEICKDLLGGLGASFRVNTFGLKLQLKVPVLEALQRLEHANLVVQVPRAGDSSWWRITAEGEQAAAAGNVADKLGRSTG